MIDQLVVAFSQRKYASISANYEPEQAIVKHTLLNPTGNYLTVLFPPWHGASVPFTLLQQRLVRKESAVLRYDFHHNILTANTKQVLESFRYIQKTVSGDLHKIVAEYGYNSVKLIGVSLGNLALSMVASYYPTISEATLVVGANKLAPSVWEGMRTQDIRRQLVSQGFDQTGLETVWQELEPARYAKAFSGKPVRFVTSDNDKVILSSNQQQLVDAFLKAGAKVQQTHKQVGHIMSIIEYSLYGRLS